MKEIILSKLFLDKLFKFFFFRNSKIFKALTYISMMIILTIAYLIVFIFKIDNIIIWFQEGTYSFGIFSIVILILLIIFSIYLIIQFNKLQKQSKVGFLDELSKTYPANSTETIEFLENGISSKNSTQNHVYFFQFNNIFAYYKMSNIYIFQSTDDSFIFVDADMYNKDEIKKVIKDNKLKKRLILKTCKKES